MDFIKNLGKNVGGDLLDSAGNVGKAFIMIKKYDENRSKADEAKEAVEALKALMKEQENTVNATSSFANLGFSDIKKIAKQNGYVPIQVQYNPNSIRFSASTGGNRRIYSGREGIGSAGDSMVTTRKVPKQITMSCKLIFESINVNDAFSFPSENPIPASFGQVVSLGADLIKKGINNKDSYGLAETYSVRKYAEGLVSLLTGLRSQDVIFYWGKTCFHGRLIRVSASYKMFNNAGDPIYAEVDIDIRQDSAPMPTPHSEDFRKVTEQENEIWRKQFDKAFSGDTNAGLGAIDKLKAGYEKFRGIL